MRLMSIASGSSGNCIYAGSGTTHVLVDAGCSRKKIAEGLNKLDLTPDDIDAVFLTHEHSDHIGGLKVLLNKHDIPVYATNGTVAGIRASGGKSALLKDGTHWIDDCNVHVVHADEEVVIGDLVIDPFATSHDAAEPVCYKLTNGTGSVAVATDMGMFDDYLSLLADNFNTLAITRLMCLDMVNVDHDGRLYDCEPNHVLGLPIQVDGRDATVDDLLAGQLPTRQVRTNPLCYSCSAGFGSSCGGALV